MPWGQVLCPGKPKFYPLPLCRLPEAYGNEAGVGGPEVAMETWPGIAKPDLAPRFGVWGGLFRGACPD